MVIYKEPVSCKLEEDGNTIDQVVEMKHLGAEDCVPL